MKPDKDYIRSLFERFNKQIFKEALLPISIEFFNGKTALAQFRYPVRTPGPRKDYISRCSFRISRLFDYEENDFEDVFLHEMIHYCIWLNNIRDTSAHGPVFRRLMEDINRKFGRNIRITTKSGEITQSDTRKRLHIICITRLRKNPDDIYITLCYRTSFMKLGEIFTSHRDILSAEWFVSADTFFNGFPRSRTPRAYVISRDDYETHILNNAVPYILTDKGLIPARRKI